MFKSLLYVGMNGIILDNTLSSLTCQQIQDKLQVKIIDKTQNQKQIPAIQTTFQQNNEKKNWDDIKQYYNKNWDNNYSNLDQNDTIKLYKELWDNTYGQLFCDYYNQQNNKNSNNTKLVFKKNNYYHYIIVLDNSGSMSLQMKFNFFSKKFENAKQSIKKFLSYANDAHKCIQSQCKMTGIQFNSSAEIVIGQNVAEEIQPDNIEQKFKNSWCFTNYDEVFKTICLVVKKNQGFDQHIILFYSDGKAEIPINLRSYLEGIPEQVRQTISFFWMIEDNDNTENMNKIQKIFSENQINSKIETLVDSQILESKLIEIFDKNITEQSL